MSDALEENVQKFSKVLHIAQRPPPIPLMYHAKIIGLLIDLVKQSRLKVRGLTAKGLLAFLNKEADRLLLHSPL